MLSRVGACWCDTRTMVSVCVYRSLYVYRDDGASIDLGARRWCQYVYRDHSYGVTLKETMRVTRVKRRRTRRKVSIKSFQHINTSFQHIHMHDMHHIHMMHPTHKNLCIRYIYICSYSLCLVRTRTIYICIHKYVYIYIYYICVYIRSGIRRRRSFRARTEQGQ